MKKLFVLLVAGVALTGGSARGDSVVTLPSASAPNPAGTLPLATNWDSPPAQPIQLAYTDLQTLWQSAGAAYGIPWQVLASINKIESNFGRNMGPSSAGAIGWMQFMPDTWRSWGVDANGDGVADPWNPIDAVYAAARYLAASGGQTDLQQAIFAYNHAQWYVDEVLQLARLYGLGSSTGAAAPVQPQAPALPPQTQGPQVSASNFAVQTQSDPNTVVFTLDRLQLRLQRAQTEVAAANGAYLPAKHEVDRLSRRIATLLQREVTTTLLSDQLALQQQIAQLTFQQETALAEAEMQRQRLEKAQSELGAVRSEAQPASFDQTAAKVLAAPAYQGSWVFPVGGGPNSVSVGHTHHDYPAADIAAPEGAPLYALGDAVVLRSWSYPDPHCGIGLTMQTNDGQVWTYCHLSYLDPSVQPGAPLKAGDPVGLVGHTGAATGPHLHLQLQPATSYPQEQDWFKSFAGTAFSWQDAPTPQPALASPFSVVQQPQTIG
jgi:murein DD-endopeptidase MepM/ murein hydrolase activator NlpD